MTRDDMVDSSTSVTQVVALFPGMGHNIRVNKTGNPECARLNQK